MNEHNRIEILGISATGYHGVFDFEKREGQTFVVDVVLELVEGQFAAAARTDDLEDTVDYGSIAQAVVDIIAGQPFDLIETLASTIADACLSSTLVTSVEVAVHKPQAPIPVPFGDVIVRLRRTRR